MTSTHLNECTRREHTTATTPRSRTLPTRRPVRLTFGRLSLPADRAGRVSPLRALMAAVLLLFIIGISGAADREAGGASFANTQAKLVAFPNDPAVGPVADWLDDFLAFLDDLIRALKDAEEESENLLNEKGEYECIEPIVSAGESFPVVKFLKVKGQHYRQCGQPFKVLKDGSFDLNADNLARFMEKTIVCAVTGKRLLEGDSNEFCAGDFMNFQLIYLDFLFPKKGPKGKRKAK